MHVGRTMWTENLIPAVYTFYGIARITSDVAEAVRQFSVFPWKMKSFVSG